MDDSMRESRDPNRGGKQAAIDEIDSLIMGACSVLASLIKDNRDPALQEYERDELMALIPARNAAARGEL